MPRWAGNEQVLDAANKVRCSMKRSIVLASICVCSLAALVAQDAARVIEVEQLEDNLFVLRGDGGGGCVLGTVDDGVFGSRLRCS